MKTLKAVLIRNLSLLATLYARPTMHIVGWVAILFLILGTMAGARLVHETVQEPGVVTQQLHGNYCRAAMWEAQLEYYTSNHIKERLGLPLAPGHEIPPVCTSYMRTYEEPARCNATGCYVVLNTNP